MKITVITGSPRKNGNSFAMTKAFIDEAERLGHTVKRFDAAFMNIGGCHACQTCYKTGKACSFDDDFNIIAPPYSWSRRRRLYNAHILVLYPGVDKRRNRPNVLVRCGRQENWREKCGIIACCEENDVSVMDGIRMPIERSASLLKWEVFGEVLLPGVLEIGDINKTDGCKQAEELAHKL